LLRRSWQNLSVDQQRTILSAIYANVMIKPAGRAGGRVDLDRVDVTWRV
jgi:hypothetical protein